MCFGSTNAEKEKENLIPILRQMGWKSRHVTLLNPNHNPYN